MGAEPIFALDPRSLEAASALGKLDPYSPYRGYRAWGVDLVSAHREHQLRRLEVGMCDPASVALGRGDPDLATLGLAEHKPLDSELFQVPVRRISQMWSSSTGRERVEAVTELCTAFLEGHPGLYLLDVDGEDVDALAGAQEAGFKVYDTSVTYACRPDEAVHAVEDAGYRLSIHDRTSPPSLSTDDIDRLVGEAAEAFEGSHFFADPVLDARRCAQLYERWAHSVLAGEWADWLVIASDEEGPCGCLGLVYASFLEPPGPTLLGDAFGFAALPRGRGVGSIMMQTFTRDAPADFVESTTQVRTTPLLIESPKYLRFLRATYVLHGWSP